MKIHTFTYKYHYGASESMCIRHMSKKIYELILQEDIFLCLHFYEHFIENF